MAIWITADPHYGHARIIELCKRPYRSVDEMDEDLIARHNARVGPRDTVYFLGDVTMRHPLRYLQRLNGKKHLFIGNHDDDRPSALKCYESVREAGMLKIDGQQIWCSHYAHLVWPKSHYGVWHLFGHSHGNLSPSVLRGKMLDVGVDSHNYAPLSFEEVREIMERKAVNVPIDHHQRAAAQANS
jgi:calcineurin-like phosphoesterase family protein